MLSSPPQPPTRKRARPRGLWRGRVNPPRCFADHVREWQQGVYSDSDTDDDERDVPESNSSSSSKRRRLSPSSSASDDSDQRDTDFCRQYTAACTSDDVDRISSWVRRTRIMDTTSTARRGAQTDANRSCTYEDWVDLKDLFSKAAEQYENAEPAEAIPLLRAVVHDCHRFLIYYQDPSVVYSPPGRGPMDSVPTSLTPTDDRFPGDWASDRSSRGRNTAPPPPPVEPRKPKPQEPATAFHAILGTALFLFGNLIAQEPKLALTGEPNTPCPYWLAALDVFETGENLPSRVNARGLETTEDWRMAIVWGRTYVCIVDDALTRNLDKKQSAPPGASSSSTGSCLSPADQTEPNWPQDSPFSAIAARRPPVTRRMSLSLSSPNDLMVLAMDQFSRGIFHMPHPQHAPPTGNTQSTSMPPLTDTFSRPKELYTIASEVLNVAEKFEIPSERQYWASWADSVFNQMKMEADMDAWRGSITRARGRCWLIVGSAKVEGIEEALERGDSGVLDSEDAQEAREGLTNAISFFERAKGSATSSSDPETQELQPLLAEALLTLANLTQDEQRREELYTRAQAEAGGTFQLDHDMVES